MEDEDGLEARPTGSITVVEYPEDAEADEPGEAPPRWAVAVITLVLVCCAGLAGMGADFLLHRFDDGNSTQITVADLNSLHLAGVWVGPDGATIVLSGNGKFAFGKIPPNIFVISAGQWPESDHDGTWSIGALATGDWSEQGLVLTGPSPGPGAGAPPQVMLLPIGSTSSPQLACYFPIDAGTCVFKRL